jgi:predicted RNA-binding Zn-ribbon protein involved in translation (DUF1610 family)
MSNSTSDSGQCSNCGSNVNRGETYCPNCGATVYPRDGRGRRVSGWLLALLALGLFVFGVMGACGLVFTILFVSEGGSDGFYWFPFVVAAVCLPIAFLCFRKMGQLRKDRAP